MGLTYISMNNREKANDPLNKAMDIYKQLNMLESYEVSFTLNNLG